MPAVSVLMPCYNAAATLNEALDSLWTQTLTDFELLAVDDGSDDATAQILAQAAANDRRVRVLRQAHSGIIPALNAGLALCQAPYVARMDADDRCYPTRLERQAAYLDTQPAVDVLACRVRAFPAQDVQQGQALYIEWLNGLLSDADIRRELFVESPLPHPSVMFRRQSVQALGGYQEHGWAEDYDLWLRLALHGARFAKLPETLLDWREHAGRLTRSDSRYSRENFLRAKAHYLLQGPLAGRDAVLMWGAGIAGRRLGRQLLHLGAPLVVYIDIDPRKIGQTRLGLPIVAPAELPHWWQRYRHPVLLAAVGARGARPIIRQRLAPFDLLEGQDWWFAA